jgi:DNA-directed RNA polymerase specialized sigma24 family protein
MPTQTLNRRRNRELIRLKYQARLSHEQIAGALSISKGLVANYVARIERAGVEC